MSHSTASELEAFDRATRALLGLIRGERRRTRTRAGRLRRAEAKLARTRRLLSALDQPHRAYPIVHVTGTSGKGSTCAAIAAILTAAGYRVGLRTSPYVQVATEKLQVGPSLVDALSFDSIVSRVLTTGRELFPEDRPGDRLGYAEAWAAIAFSWFAERRVDIAVVEVGAGGRYDATNVVAPTVSVITSVGLDHVVSLGPTIADIAWHKAGIIKPGAIAVVGALPAAAWTVVKDEAESAGVPILCSESLEVARGDAAMTGAFQRANASVAIAAARALTRRGFVIPDAAIASGLSAARLPGRLERMPTDAAGPPVWIDGAHNGDKIAALAVEAQRLIADGPLPVIVIGVLATKDVATMLRGITPAASAIVATEPAVLGKRSLPAPALAAAARAAGYTGALVADANAAAALDRAEAIAREQGTAVLVTGSLYLAGQLRRRWYADADIVVQRTPWPIVPGSDPSSAL